jgi:8-oxo-dGTP pyrophosphatase MutT (NUDIX family)
MDRTTRDLIVPIESAIQRFEVSLKAFVLRKDCALFVREADTGLWELPGGRIDVGEERLNHDAILRREIAEELGSDFLFSIGDAAVTWVRQRPSDWVFQFIVARICLHEGGEPALSGEHTNHVWAKKCEWQTLALPALSDYRSALERLWVLADAIG